MTLIDLARAWLERQTFTSAKELKEKFLTDFSPYGKTHRQWIAKWAELKFNPDIDNIDEFLEKFEDLAQLNNLRRLQDTCFYNSYAIRDRTSFERHRQLATLLSNSQRPFDYTTEPCCS